jgi:hypothetical protein
VIARVPTAWFSACLWPNGFDRMVNNSKSVRSDATLKSTPNTLKTVKVTQLGCNFLSEEVIKKVIKTETPGSDQGKGRWIGSQTHWNTQLLQTLSGPNMLLGTWFVLRGLPLDFQRDSVVVDHDGPTAAHGSGDDLSHHRR